MVINDIWPIDFFISFIGTFIQLDGVYWHGLDRPILKIKESKSARDQQIYKKWLTDREQDRWFQENKLNLVRITDLEAKEIINASKL